MSGTSIFLNGVMDVVALAYPPAGAVIAALKLAEPYAEAAFPVIRAAISEGPAAFAAARAKAPQFFTALGNAAAIIKAIPGAAPSVSGLDVAHLAARVVGVDPPGWDHAETQVWWERASAANLG